MLKRRLASALFCAALLLALAPSRALAQTQRAAPEARNLSAPLAETKPRLKALFSESKAKAKSSALTAADFKRFETARWQDDPPPKKEKWSKSTKAIVIILVVVFVGVSVWAIANPGDDPPPDCFNDPSNILCQ